MKKELMAYAIQNGKVVHIDTVEKGLSCNCFCPSCNARMVARKGKYRVHHFAHYNAKPCETGFQTAVHLKAKDILAEMSSITLPSHKFIWSGKEWHIPPMTVGIADVVLEQKVDTIVPDVIITTNKGQRIFVEVYVTHKVDDEKEKKIKELDIPTIEIDLSKCELNDNLLAKALTREIEEYGRWVYYGKEEFYKNKIRKLTTDLSIGKDGSVDCPLLHDLSSDKSRPLKGYADECTAGSKCWYFLGKTDKCVHCMGSHYANDIPFLMKYPEKNRQAIYRARLNTKPPIVDKIKKSLSYFASLPVEGRSGCNHPVNRLKLKKILSIDSVTDTGCQISRLKVTGLNTDEEKAVFYINVIDSSELAWLWGRKWYEDLAIQRNETVVVYKNIYDDYVGKRKYKMSHYINDATPEDNDEDYVDYDYDDSMECVTKRTDKTASNTPSLEVERQQYIPVGNGMYAECHQLFKNENINHCFVQNGLCSLCPKHESSHEEDDKFLCIISEEYERKSGYDVMKAMLVKYLSDDKAQLLKEELLERGIVKNDESCSFLEIDRAEMLKQRMAAIKGTNGK